MSEFAHSASLQDKIEAELAAAFDDVSSDEEVDDRAYEAPHEKLQLKVCLCVCVCVHEVVVIVVLIVAAAAAAGSAAAC